MEQQPNQKRSARVLARRVLDSISGSDLRAWSGKLLEHLEADPVITRATRFLTFSPLPGEPLVSPFTLALLRRGVSVAIPRVDWDSISMTPALISSLASLQPSRHGILTPPADAPALPLETIEVALVPGLSFDLGGARLGRGGGFYDRLLGDSRWNGRAIGVCFEAQLVQSVPRQAHDAPMDAIATERGVRWIRS